MYIKVDKDTEVIIKAIRDGYGGTWHNGDAGDRRRYKHLKEIPANEKLGIPEPIIHNKECVNGTDCEWCESRRRDYGTTTTDNR